MATDILQATPGGISYAVAAPLLVGHGFCADDPRLMMLVNKATLSLLSEVIPVGGMATYDLPGIVSTTDFSPGTQIWLPRTLENAITVEVLNGSAVHGQTDVAQGWFQLVNQSTYVDPGAAADNPLVDMFLVPDVGHVGGDPTFLRRLYNYPGLSPGATVRVTGAKRYLPITQGTDYLIIQNIRALELEMNAIQKSNFGDPDMGANYHKQAVDLLTAECRKHLLDPINSMQRKANYETDMTTFEDGTYGFVRALLAFDIPGGLLHGKSELSRLLDMSEQRLMNKGSWVGCLEEFRAQVFAGRIYAPMRVKSILAASLCGEPLDVRNIFFQYQQNGPGRFDCGRMLIDEGQEMVGGSLRRQYRLVGGSGQPDPQTTPPTDGDQITFVAKLRWVKKQPTDMLTIQNVEAHRLMITSIIHQQAEKWPEAAAAEALAIKELDSELTEYLSGQALTIPMREDVWCMKRVGSML